MEQDNMILDIDHQKVMYPVPPKVKQTAYLDFNEYKKLYEESISSPDTFWGRMASEHLTWFRPFTKVRSGTFADGDIAWFLDGELNVSYNCLDRHLNSKRDQVAIIWEGDQPNDIRKITYFQLFQEVCRLSNVLLSLGLRKGDTVAIYLPNCPEAAYSMLACARIGVVHSIVFAGFSSESLSDRIIDAKCKCVITADQFFRGGRPIFLKKIVDEALLKSNTVQHVLVLQRAKNPDTSSWIANRDIDLQAAMNQQRPYCPAVSLNSEDPLFLLYTSGSTGKPKGLLHTQAGYLLNAALTHRYVFDYHPGDVYACVADVGWITGHSYIVYGPLCNGATTLMFEGLPTLPDAGRYWDMVQRHKITQFYTAPTAIRTLMKFGNDFVKKYDRSSLRILGSVGEPINPEAWKWYYDIVGEGQCAIVDTYWQTESGAHLLTPIPGAITTKAGSATVPFFGIKPEVLDATTGKVLHGNNVSGVLAIAAPWPSIARTIYNGHDRYLTTYMKSYQGYYFTGDGVERDQDGYYWISGRVDDVVNVSGHRLGTAELESALVCSPACAEAAVIGIPHDVKGQAIFAYCILKDGYEDSFDMVQSLKTEVRKRIGPFATPDFLLVVPALPKTRSGKIMRRVLRKIACNETKPEQLGDISTLADPSIVPTLIKLVEEMQQELKVLDSISHEHKKHKTN